MQELIRQLAEGFAATSIAEWIAVATGLVYILLIIRRHRAGWVAGALSSLILAVLFAGKHLPMQALLQAFYVAAAVYGWWRWSGNASQQRISTWRLKGHLLVVTGGVLLSLALAWLLAREGYSAFPFTDSLVACGGLFATWLVARVYLENWLYWIALDSVSIYLCIAQGLPAAALLFALYLGIAIHGFFSWRRTWRAERGSL